MRQLKWLRASTEKTALTSEILVAVSDLPFAPEPCGRGFNRHPSGSSSP
jgi:hypothetical protein